MTSMLDVSRLTISFGDLRVLDGLSFAVAHGECLAIIGPNGSGKTVLLRALIGALPYEGTIQWAADARVGYVPQKLDIERDLPLTGMDLLRARAHVAGAPRIEISRALAMVRLGVDVADRPIGTLSGGSFQRLLLALAFLGRPNVLLFDEPTAGIDQPGEELLYETIHRWQRDSGLTLLLVSHELSVVRRYATRVLCLGRARICLGPPSEILTPQVLEGVYGAPMNYHFHQ